MEAAQRYEALIEKARELERSGDWTGAFGQYELAVAAAVTMRHAAAVVDVLRWQGTVLRAQDDVDGAVDLYTASLHAAEANDLPGRVAAAVNCLGIIEQTRGQLDDAAAYYRRARDLADVAGDERLAAMADQNLGTIANIRGDVAAAAASYRAALGRFRQLGDERAAAWALVNTGIASTHAGDVRAAESCFDDAFDLAERLRDMDLLGTVELHRAELFIAAEKQARARQACERAFEIFARLRAEHALGEVQRVFGRLYRSEGRPYLAAERLQRAVAIARAQADPLLEAESESELALTHLSVEQNKEALQSLNRAHALFNILGARREIADLELRLDRLEETYLRVVQRWAESIEEKDRYTAGHCQRVADYGCLMAEAIGVTGRDLTWFRMGAFLHDVGKTAVPAEVLNKPGALTDEEWALMKSHTTVGDDIVAEIGFPWDIRPIVRSHHERWDGTGYPDGSAGEDIPRLARVLCVVDVYDALTTARSYRPALPQDEALRIMARDSGRILDPELFELFRSLLAKGQAAAAPARPRIAAVA